jgi:integrase
MLTAKNVLSLPAPERGRRDYWDEIVSGLSLRVSADGTRAYCLRYRVDRKRRRMTLGQVGVLPLADARALARDALRLVAAGQDPQAAKASRRRVGATFRDLATRFLEDNAERMRPSTRAGWERYVERELLPAFGDRAPAEITRGDVRVWVKGIARRAPVSANRAFEVLRRVYSWAIAEELVATSPCIGLGGKRRQRRVLLAEEKPRDRVYTTDEIRAILAAVPGTQIEDLVALIFHTATRSEETRAARWSEIDLDARLWTIPGERSKNGKAHPVPLSSGAMRVLERIRAEHPTGFLFPAASRSGYMDKPNKSTSELRATVADGGSGVADFRLHDVRRTVATRLAEMGTSDAIVEWILGHAMPQLRQTYNLYTPVREMRTTLEAWSAELARIVAGSDRRIAQVVQFSA